MPELGRQLRNLYAQLSVSAVGGPKAWKMTQKFHMFLHLCEDQIPNLGLNPRWYWTYADEDLVGLLIEVAHSCHVRTLAPTAMTKWLLMSLARDT